MRRELFVAFLSAALIVQAVLRRRPSLRKGIDRLAGTVMGTLALRLLISGRHS